MEYFPNPALWACLISGEQQNIWLQWIGFAGSAGVPLRKARAVLTAQYQSPLQRLPILPELSLKRWSCPEASSLPHQGLSLTLWCQKSQLKLNELAQGLIPSLHPTPCRTPAVSLLKVPVPTSAAVRVDPVFRMRAWVRLGIWLHSEADSCSFPTSTLLWLSLHLCKSSLKMSPLIVQMLFFQQAHPLHQWDLLVADSVLSQFTSRFMCLFLCPGQNCDAKNM